MPTFRNTLSIPSSSIFLISNFRRVLYVVIFLLCNSPASEFYMPTFRNTVYSIFINLLISNFHLVLYVVIFLLCNLLASEFYMPTFRNTLYIPSLSVFFISNFRHVLNVVCFLLCNSPASKFYMPTFRTTPSVPSLCLLYLKLSPCSECCMFSSVQFRGIWMLYADVSEHSACSIFYTYLPTKMEQSVTKRRDIKFRCRGIIQNKTKHTHRWFHITVHVKW
jgi:hypothetical protein